MQGKRKMNLVKKETGRESIWRNFVLNAEEN